MIIQLQNTSDQNVFVEHEFYQQINATPGLNVQQIKCYTWLYSTTAQVPNRMVEIVAENLEICHIRIKHSGVD
jgi:hypothetical protein